jgi:hypothetical protein
VTQTNWPPGNLGRFSAWRNHEPKRQAGNNPSALNVDAKQNVIEINWPFNIDDLVMVSIARSPAGRSAYLGRLPGCVTTRAPPH